MNSFPITLPLFGLRLFTPESKQDFPTTGITKHSDLLPYPYDPRGFSRSLEKTYRGSTKDLIKDGSLEYFETESSLNGY